MVSAGDFKNGLTIEIEGNIFQILEFQHVKPGKGAAFVRTKLKNIISGGVEEKTFRPTEKFDTAHIDRKDMQYLYSDGELYHFMDVETFDQIAVDGDTVGDSLKFVKENEMVKVCSHEGNVFSVEPPISVELEVTETEPGTNFKASYSINGGTVTDGAEALFTMATTGSEAIQFTNTSTIAPPVTGRDIQNSSWIMMLIVALLIGMSGVVFFRKVKRKYR